MLRKFFLSAALVALSGCASIDRLDAGVQQEMVAFRDAFNCPKWQAKFDLPETTRSCPT